MATCDPDYELAWFTIGLVDANHTVLLDFTQVANVAAARVVQALIKHRPVHLVAVIAQAVTGFPACLKITDKTGQTLVATVPLAGDANSGHDEIEMRAKLSTPQINIGAGDPASVTNFVFLCVQIGEP